MGMLNEADNGQRKLREMVEGNGFEVHRYSVIDSKYERKVGSTTESLDWREAEGEIRIWYSKEGLEGRSYLDDGKLDANLNPLNIAGKQILERIFYKPGISDGKICLT